MITRENSSQGKKTKTRAYMRRVHTSLRSELLVGDGWEAIAHAELKRIKLELLSYHNQLEGKPGYDNTGIAIDALKMAAQELEVEYGEAVNLD